MADEEQEKKEKDREFLTNMRNEQRDLTMAELKKEQLEVGTRVQEEQKKLETAQAAVQTGRAKRGIFKVLAILVIIGIGLLMYYFYTKGYFNSIIPKK